LLKAWQKAISILKRAGGRDKQIHRAPFACTLQRWLGWMNNAFWFSRSGMSQLKTALQRSFLNIASCDNRVEIKTKKRG
jgi:hypothetical protein